MLDSIEGKGRKNSAEITVKGAENRRKAETQTDAGRPFMKLSKSEVGEVVNIIEKDIIKDIKKQGL